MKRPGSAEDISDIVKDAISANEVIEITGNGSKRDIGQTVMASIEISTTEMAEVLEYNHSELVMTAQAGTSLKKIREVLDANNQMLAFEPADYSKLLNSQAEPTIGGTFGVNLTGSKRLSTGAARDALLGVNFINGSGELIKTGGKVMKNVTGLDLVKLMAGSWGTLGIMADMTFKVLPKPELIKTVLIMGMDDATAAMAMAKAMAQSVEVSSAAHLSEGVSNKVLDGGFDRPITALRLEGLVPSVELREAKLKNVMSQFGDLEMLDHKKSDQLWNEISNVYPFCDGSDQAVWKVSVAPNLGCQLVSKLKENCRFDAYYDWQGGLVWLKMHDDTHADTIRKHIRELGGGHATLIRADGNTKAQVPVFEPQAEPIEALSRRIKAKLDPHNLFNPGRMTFPSNSQSAGR